MSFERIVGWVESKFHDPTSSETTHSEADRTPVLQVLFSRLATKISAIFSSIIEGIIGGSGVNSARKQVATATEDHAETVISHITSDSPRTDENRDQRVGENSGDDILQIDTEEKHTVKDQITNKRELRVIFSAHSGVATDSVEKNQPSENNRRNDQKDIDAIKIMMPERFDLIWNTYGFKDVKTLLTEAGVDSSLSNKYANELALYETSLVNSIDFVGDRAVLDVAILELLEIVAIDNQGCWAFIPEERKKPLKEILLFLIGSYEKSNLTPSIKKVSHTQKFASPGIEKIEKNFNNLRSVQKAALIDTFSDTRLSNAPADHQMNSALNALISCLIEKYPDREIKVAVDEFRKLVRYVDMRASQPVRIMNKDIPDVERLQPFIEALREVDRNPAVLGDLMSSKIGGALSSKRSSALALLVKCFEGVLVSN